MKTTLIGACLALALLASPALASTASAASTGSTSPQPGQVVSENPDNDTPNVVDGTVLSFAKVGNLVVVGGTFTGVRNAGSTTVLPRANVFAFDATTKKVSTTFVPDARYASGKASTVFKVLPASDGTSVYIGGDFDTVTSQGAAVTTTSRLVKVSASSGTRDATFAPGAVDGQIRDLEVTGNRLWLAGKFTYVQGKPRRALASLNATTGLSDGYVTSVFAGQHRDPATYKDTTSVLNIATNPANNRLVAVGNFATVDGQARPQVAMFDISGSSTAALASWSLPLYTSSCDSKFETSVTDVSFSTDGSYVIIPSAGGYGGSVSSSGTSGCDVVARFETAATGTSIKPTWTAYTGGDSTWTVEVTADAIYAGGHQRWQNNPSGNNVAAQGAVSREGIAALDPVNGMPYSWNPTRTRGVGIKDMLATDQGLYVGSDTTTFAKETHERLAFLPLAGGKTLPTSTPVSLPAAVVSSDGSTVQQRTFDGTTVTAGPTPSADQTTFTNSVGAFVIGKDLYVAYKDGTLKKGTWDGTTFTPTKTTWESDALVRQADWHDTDLPSLQSLFYSGGRIYFTRANQNVLFSRGFEPESGVVGQLRASSAAITGVTYSDVRGAFVAGGKYYFAKTNGSLSSVAWNGTAPQGAVTTLTGAGLGWSSKVLFLYPGKVDAAPTAALSATCAGTTCSFDASGSSDPDGSIASYAWSFGDGATASGATAEHTYASAGQRTVTLTVTDDAGAKSVATKDVTAEDVTSPVAFVDAATSTGNRVSHNVSVPSSVRAGDQLLLFFTGNATSATYSTPSGWDVAESQAGDGMTAYALTRTATSDDAGKTVTVTSSAYVKDVMTVAAYRGGKVTASKSLLDTADRTTRTTPTVSATDSHQWLVSYWTDKGSSTTAWSLPGGQTRRSSVFGTTSGHTSAILADGDDAVGSGAQGGLAASTDVAGSAAVTFSLLIG